MERYQKSELVTRYHLVERTEKRRDGSVLGPYTDSSSNLIDERYVDGYKNPRWKTQVERHQNATTPLTAQKTDGLFSAPGFSARRELVWKPNYGANPVVEVNIEGNHNPFFDSFATVGNYSIDQAKNEALARFHQKLQEAHNHLLGGVMLGEADEVIRMLKQPLSGLKRGMQRYQGDVKKHAQRWHKRRDFERALADTYLEYTFGWRPLISDIQSVAEYAYDKAEKPSTVNVSASARVVLSETRNVQNYGNTLLRMSYWRTSRKCVTVRYQGEVTGGNGLRGKAKNLGFAPEHIIPTAYELIPWSFVVDYFSNLGDMVRGVGNMFAKPAWHSHTIRRYQEIEYRFRGILAYNHASLLRTFDYPVPSNALFTRKHITRVPDTGYVEIPDFELRLPSLKQLLNLGALGTGFRVLNRQIERKFNLVKPSGNQRYYGRHDYRS